MQKLHSEVPSHCKYDVHVFVMFCDVFVCRVTVYTTENHVVLYTYNPINDLVSLNVILPEVETRNSSFFL